MFVMIARDIIIKLLIFVLILSTSKFAAAQNEIYPPNYNSLTSDQKRWLDKSCATSKSLKFSYYKDCVDKELPKIISGLSYDLTTLTSDQKRWLDKSCATSKSLKFSYYNDCVDKELPKIISGLSYDLTTLTSDQKRWLDKSCATSKSLKFSYYKDCVDKELPAILNVSNNRTVTIAQSSISEISKPEYEPNRQAPSGTINTMPTTIDQPSDSPKTIADPEILSKQSILSKMGLYKSKIDGIYGPATKKAEDNLIALKAIYKSLDLYVGDVDANVNPDFVKPFLQLQNSSLESHVLQKGYDKKTLRELANLYLVGQSHESQQMAKEYIRRLILPKPANVSPFPRYSDNPKKRSQENGAYSLVIVTSVIAAIAFIWFVGIVENEKKVTAPSSKQSEHNLEALLLTLYAKLCKIDGKVDKEEIRVVKNLIRTSKIPDASSVFDNAVRSSEKYSSVAIRIANLIEADASIENKFMAKLLILEHLAHIILADGKVDQNEVKFFRDVAKKFGFEYPLIDSLISEINLRHQNAKNQDYNTNQPESGYKAALELLELEKDFTMKDLIEARRRKAKELHPDILKSQGMPQHIIDECESLLKRVNAAFDLLKKIYQKA